MKVALVPPLVTFVTFAVMACAPTRLRQDVPCDFVALQDGDLGHVDRCAVRTNSGWLVHRDVLAKVRFDDDGFTEARIDGQFCVVNRRGKAVTTVWVDNGRDGFAEGLARTTRNGKVGFVDTALLEVIAPRWDFAWPFEGGLATVCRGCVTRRVGEYQAIVGGKWGYIDKTGRVAVPVIYTRESLPKRDALRGMR